MAHIHVIQQAIEKCAEINKPLYVAFIDYEKEFDSVETAAVLAALRDQGVEEAHVSILEEIYHKCTSIHHPS